MAKRHLTQRQRARIQAIQAQRRERLEQQAEASLTTAAEALSREGRVIVRHGATLLVEETNGGRFQCLTRQNIGHPVCGDRVVWHQVDETTGVVTALLPRDSVLSRPDSIGQEKPLAANITQLVVVLSPQPAPSGYLLDQYLVTAEVIGVKPLIAINKIDLLAEDEKATFLEQFRHYAAIGYRLVEVSARQEHGLDRLISELKGGTNILVGQSGVGKSSLINALLPAESVETGRLSEATGQGRHTTSAATCFHLPQGGELIDSPGVRSFRLTRLTSAQLEQGFPEFQPYLGQCRFHNCAHDQEPGCAVRAAVASGLISPLRLESFLRLSSSITHNPT